MPTGNLVTTVDVARARQICRGNAAPTLSPHLALLFRPTGSSRSCRQVFASRPEAREDSDQQSVRADGVRPLIVPAQAQRTHRLLNQIASQGRLEQDRLTEQTRNPTASLTKEHGKGVGVRVDVLVAVPVAVAGGFSRPAG